MDFEHATKSGERFHKAATVLASHAMGLTTEQIIENNYSLPIVLHQNGILYVLNMGTSKKDDDFITPYVVNASFSLELSLKILIFLETKKWSKNHNLDQLYEKISKKSKEFISENVKNSSNNKEIKEFISFLKSQKIEIEWDVFSLLERSNSAFTKWRYAFEGQPGCFAGYSQIHSAIRERIKAIS
jgi:hypothetical protein